jgi:methionyl-tRNA formyltransferase
MKKIILLSEKERHLELFKYIQEKFKDAECIYINKQHNFKLEELEKLNPDKIFIPHWSYIIPNEIHENFECVVFHMTDLPFGRGGSPLQNLIVRGHKNTMISALKVVEGLDAGPIYLKKPLSLEGTAQEIFQRADEVIKEMITEIVNNNPKPLEQVGDVVNFKRRKPHESDISSLKDPSVIFDYIRMLDAEGYPKAFIETDTFKLEFTQAKMDKNNNLIAYVNFIKK